MSWRPLIAALLVLAATAAAADGSRELLEEDGVQAAIADGYDAALNRFRWMTSLRHSMGPLKGDPICGAVLISSTVLLTAASCTVNGWGIPRKATLFPWARIGTNTRRGGEYEIRFVTGVLLHSGWNRTVNPALNDVALMRLGGGRIPAVPSQMTPIRLPPKKPNLPVPAGTKLAALGFGDWGKPNVPHYLQEVQLTVRPQRVCQQQWPAQGKLWSTRRAFCAGTLGEAAGICSGDYGGPLFVKGRTVKQDRLVGIAAFNGPKGCGRGGLSGFLNVAQYRGWIDLGVQILKGQANATAAYKAFYNQKEVTPL